jgi:predicted transcriptional regulator
MKKSCKRVLLSIKPEFANLIFEGQKDFEFRRAVFKDPEIRSVVVYASSPVQKVIGEFEIESILHEHLDVLWENTKHAAGIERSYYDSYYHGKEKGYAIKVGKRTLYDSPKSLKHDFEMLPPQSFAYL